MRICFIGDSFVAGVGDQDSLGWVGRLCRDARSRGIEITGYNLGIRRDTSTDIAMRWREEAQRRLPDDQPGALIFEFGVNDCIMENGRQRVALAHSVETLRTILTDAVAWKPTLMIGPPPVDDLEINLRIAELTQLFESECGTLQVPYLNTYPMLASSPHWARALTGGDGAHPCAAGYAAWADLVDRWPAWAYLMSQCISGSGTVAPPARKS